MSKFKKISGQATGLGVASLVVLAGWLSPSFAQETTPAAPAGSPAKAGKPANPSASAGAGDKKKSDAVKLRIAEDHPGKPGDKPDSAESGEKAPKAKAQVVSRDEAIEHYREAQKALLKVEEPSDPKSEAAAEARKERRDAMRDLRRARDEILRAHNAARRDFQKRDPDDVEALRKQVAQRTAEMRKDRKDRSQKEREATAKLVGDKPLHPAVREELRNHAWRLARLNQLIYLAELDKKPAFAEKAKALIEKENTSHQERLKALLAKAEVKNYKPPVAPAPVVARVNLVTRLSCQLAIPPLPSSQPQLQHLPQEIRNEAYSDGSVAASFTARLQQKGRKACSRQEGREGQEGRSAQGEEGADPWTSS